MALNIHRYGQLSYLLHAPQAEMDDTRRKHPLILYLHGAGERGSDPTLLKQYGLTRVVNEQAEFPFIVLAPQCPEEGWWSDNAAILIALLDHVITHQFADERRIYLTGASMGGYGAWELGSLYPQRFAAVVPICGVALYNNPDVVCGLRDVPVWAFHGTADKVVAADNTEMMISALQNCGGEPLVTYVKGAGHELGTEAYRDRALFAWMMRHTLPRIRQTAAEGE
jgi:predicted peptidase